MDTPTSYFDWLKSNHGILLNPAAKAFVDQPKWIVLDENGNPIGTAPSMKVAEAVMDASLTSRLANFGRNDDADLDAVR